MMPVWLREQRRRERQRAPLALRELQLLLGKGHCIDCSRITDNMVELDGEKKKEFICKTCEADRLQRH